MRTSIRMLTLSILFAASIAKQSASAVNLAVANGVLTNEVVSLNIEVDVSHKPYTCSLHYSGAAISEGSASPLFLNLPFPSGFFQTQREFEFRPTTDSRTALFVPASYDSLTRVALYKDNTGTFSVDMITRSPMPIVDDGFGWSRINGKTVFTFPFVSDQACIINGVHHDDAVKCGVGEVNIRLYGASIDEVSPSGSDIDDNTVRLRYSAIEKAGGALKLVLRIRERMSFLMVVVAISGVIIAKLFRDIAFATLRPKYRIAASLAVIVSACLLYYESWRWYGASWYSTAATAVYAIVGISLIWLGTAIFDEFKNRRTMSNEEVVP
ncbi:MAG: hypothetical protein Q7W56_06665 [Candidatus Latescibacteria bacterium]|nr:hypothetical protein [Candidatus Latescibacterota bacterium]